MALADLVTVDEVKAFLGFPTSNTQDEALQPFVTSVSDFIRSYCGQDFTYNAYAAETRNGNAKADIYALNPPIDGTQPITVTEDGIALLVATGYNTAVDVIVNLDDGVFHRQAGPTPRAIWNSQRVGTWSKGFSNVVLGYTGGFKVMPEGLKMVVKRIIAHFWKETSDKRIAVESSNETGSSVRWMEDIPKAYLKVLDIYTQPFRPPR